MIKRKAKFLYGMSKGEVAFEIVNMLFLALIAFTTLYPFWYVAVKSIMTFEEAVQTPIIIFPKTFSVSAYEYIFATSKLVQSMMITVAFTVVATLWQLACTAITAYALSKNDLPGRNILFNFIIVTMFFGGGLIPNYLLIKNLGLMNSYLALILPGTVGTYNMIVMKTFFIGIPVSLEESARIEGASYFKIFTKIILPLSAPVLATITLFLAVGHWNSWYAPLLYLTDSSKWPMALVLRQILVKSDINTLSSSYVSDNYMLSDQIKMACIMLSIIPIIIVYPFLQKYFAKGVMIGSVKE